MKLFYNVKYVYDKYVGYFDLLWKLTSSTQFRWVSCVKLIMSITLFYVLTYFLDIAYSNVEHNNHDYQWLVVETLNHPEVPGQKDTKRH